MTTELYYANGYRYDIAKRQWYHLDTKFMSDEYEWMKIQENKVNPRVLKEWKYDLEKLGISKKVEFLTKLSQTFDDVPVKHGKYKGKTAREISRINPSYIIWAADEKIAWCKVTEQLLDECRQLMPVRSKKRASIFNNISPDEDYDAFEGSESDIW